MMFLAAASWISRHRGEPVSSNDPCLFRSAPRGMHLYLQWDLAGDILKCILAAYTTLDDSSRTLPLATQEAATGLNILRLDAQPTRVPRGRMPPGPGASKWG
jgi:hypothetical protein